MEQLEEENIEGGEEASLKAEDAIEFVGTNVC